MGNRNFFSKSFYPKPIYNAFVLGNKLGVEKYVIDKTHANAYTKFVELGEPQNPSEEVKQAIREAGALKLEPVGVITPADNKVSVTMDNNAVVLLELFPM